MLELSRAKVWISLVGCALVMLTACGEGDPEAVATDPDASTAETSTVDSTSPDTLVTDSGADDTTTVDTLVTETSVSETSAETAVADTAVADTAVVDTAVADTAVADTAVTDTAVTDTAVTDTPDAAPMCTAPLAAPACNSIVMPSSATFVTAEVGALPTFTEGGTYPDGYYVLVKEIINSGTPGTTKQTFLLASGCLQSLSIKTDGTVTRANATSTKVSSTETVTFTCPFVLTFSGAKYGIKSITGGKYTIITQGTVGASTTYREWVQQ